MSTPRHAAQFATLALAASLAMPLWAGTPTHTAQATQGNSVPPTGTRIDGPDGPCASLNRRIITREDLERTGHVQLSSAISRATTSATADLKQCREREQADQGKDKRAG